MTRGWRRKTPWWLGRCGEGMKVGRGREVWFGVWGSNESLAESVVFIVACLLLLFDVQKEIGEEEKDRDGTSRTFMT